MKMMRLLSEMVSDLKNYDRLGEAEMAELLEATRPTAQQFVEKFFDQPKGNIRECTAFVPFRSDFLLAQARVRGLGAVGVVIVIREGYKIFTVTGSAVARFLRTGDESLLGVSQVITDSHDQAERLFRPRKWLAFGSAVS
jgi:hypothetical protein